MLRKICLVLVVSLGAAAAPALAELQAGFAQVDVTPSVGEAPVWIAGYGNNRPAIGVHDPLFARAVALSDGERTVALVSIDVIGLQLPDVQRIRAEIDGVDYVLVSSTHNHEGPDVIGIWGPSPVQRGVNPEYVDSVVSKTAECVRAAVASLAPATASYGTAIVPGELLRDSRLPEVKDDVLRVIALHDAERPEAFAGLLVQYSCHPESLGSENQQLTADFPHVVIAELRRRYNCPVVYFTGAVGGLMSNPSRITSTTGEEMTDGDFAYAEEYGRQIAAVVQEAVAASEPVALTPLGVHARMFTAPMANPLYRAALGMGVLTRGAVEYTGDYRETDRPLPEGAPVERYGVQSEVAYLRLGDVNVAAIPGEIYPELVYGRFQEPVEPNVDYPEAPLEPSIVDLLPGDKLFLLGLANDELGYILPKRQWDQAPPYAYGRERGQYGEVNSCGPDIAPILMKAFSDCVADAAP